MRVWMRLEDAAGPADAGQVAVQSCASHASHASVSVARSKLLTGLVQLMYPSRRIVTIRFRRRCARRPRSLVL